MQVVFDHEYSDHGHTKATMNNHYMLITQENKEFDNVKHQVLLTPKQIELIVEFAKKQKRLAV